MSKSNAATRDPEPKSKGAPQSQEDLKEKKLQVPESSKGLRNVTMTTRTTFSKDRNEPGVPDPYLGATVDGRYEIESVLGEGGMGVVYRCTHSIIGKNVAMKILRADLARNDKVVERFLNEARSASSIGNPHIIDISDFGRLPDGATYFVMEYLEGTPLSDFLDRNHLLEPQRIGQIGIQLTEALAAAHEAKIVHRDLKPDNIFVLPQGPLGDFVKVLDFGIAKATSVASKLTQAGQVFGTPHYMAPEQAAGSAVDHRADIYSVGVILFELLTGRLPFEAENFMAILSQHMYKEPPSPSTLSDTHGRVDPNFEYVILRCLRKDPEERYQSMSELGQDLRYLFDGAPKDHPHEPRLSQLAWRQPNHPVEKPSKWRRPLGWALTGLVVVTLGTAGWAYRSGLLSPAQEPEKVEPLAQKAATPPPSNATPSDATPSSATTSVAIAVEPLNAHVFRGEKDLGTSPVMLEVGREPVTLEVRAAGHESKTLTVDGKTSKVSLSLSPLADPPSAKTKDQADRPAPSRSRSSRRTQPSSASSPTSSNDSSELVYPW